MSAPTKRTRFPAVRSRHAADTIFQHLAAAILHGEFPIGEPLPPERVLGEEFDVSRMILRQAIHRLADVGLVRVRQGGATIVLDPGDAHDIRVIGLYYRLHPDGTVARAVRRDVVEKQFLQGYCLLDVCARRAARAEKKRIQDLALAFDEASSTDTDFDAFEETFWRAVARAGANRIFQMETAWWYESLASARPPAPNPPPLAVRIGFYRELGRRLVSGDGASAYYLAVATPQLDALFAQREQD